MNQFNKFLHSSCRIKRPEKHWTDKILARNVTSRATVMSMMPHFDVTLDTSTKVDTDSHKISELSNLELILSCKMSNGKETS